MLHLFQFPRRASVHSLVLMAGAALLATASHAQVNQVAIFRSGVNSQTGPSSSSSDFYFMSDRAFEGNPSAIGSASLSYPPSQTGTLTVNGSEFDYSPATQPTLTDLNSAFPTGNYVTSWQGGTAGSGSSTIAYTGDIYPNIPLFSASTYGSLITPSGVDTSSGLTFDWNSFTPNGAANENDIFFSILDLSTNADVYSNSFQPSTTTSNFVPASDFTPGQSYQATIDFSSRINDFGISPGTVQGFDQLTEADFQTPAATPEPTPVATFGVAIIGLTCLLMRARRKMTSK